MTDPEKLTLEIHRKIRAVQERVNGLHDRAIAAAEKRNWREFRQFIEFAMEVVDETWKEILTMHKDKECIFCLNGGQNPQAHQMPVTSKVLH